MSVPDPERVSIVDPDRWRSRADGPRFLYAAPGRLRAPWRLIAFAVALFIMRPIVESVLSPVFGGISRVVGEPVAAFEWIMLIATLGAIAFVLRTIDEAPWHDVALDAASWRIGVTLRGASLGASAIAATIGVLWASGALHWVPYAVVGDSAMSSAQQSVAAWRATALRLAVMLAPAALWEELIFRGYLWTVAENAGGVRIARWSTAVAFGFIHITNPGAGVMTTVLVIVAGWCLGAIRERTGSLMSAWGAHFAWNWVMAAIVHVPVSGLVTETPGYRAVVSGPSWWTGGAWGPEGGAAALLVMGGALLWLAPPTGWRPFRTGSMAR